MRSAGAAVAGAAAASATANAGSARASVRGIARRPCEGASGVMPASLRGAGCGQSRSVAQSDRAVRRRPARHEHGDRGAHAEPGARVRSPDRRARGYGQRMALSLFAGIRVRDLAAARPWYECLLGAPAFFPNSTEVVWRVADERFIYIQEDPARAGEGLVTAVVDDLDAVVANIASRGLEPVEHETYDNGVRKVTYRDDDGNEVGFGGGP